LSDLKKTEPNATVGKVVDSMTAYCMRQQTAKIKPFKLVNAGIKASTHSAPSTTRAIIPKAV